MNEEKIKYALNFSFSATLFAVVSQINSNARLKIFGLIFCAKMLTAHSTNIIIETSFFIVLYSNFSVWLTKGYSSSRISSFMYS